MGKTRLIFSQSLTTEIKHNLSEISSHKHKYSVLLDNIRSAWNAGSILRSADGFGYSHAYMCGITPTPDNDAVKKTSLGSERSVTWTYHNDAVILATDLRSRGWNIVALEDHEHSRQLTDVSKHKKEKPTLLIVGNETTGVDNHLLDLCDEIYHIPMYGEKKSFNVAIAFSIASYAITR